MSKGKTMNKSLPLYCKTEDIPSDYEVCEVCGYDHDYDHLFLTDDEWKFVKREHLKSECKSTEYEDMMEYPEHF
jgi:hypothetical protein